LLKPKINGEIEHDFGLNMLLRLATNLERRLLHSKAPAGGRNILKKAKLSNMN
jgi:hypothetical protein